MKPFDYQRIRTVAEIGARHAAATRFLAGGTNLIDLMKHELSLIHI